MKQKQRAIKPKKTDLDKYYETHGRHVWFDVGPGTDPVAWENGKLREPDHDLWDDE
jgi:hypothetical protein